MDLVTARRCFLEAVDRWLPEALREFETFAGDLPANLDARLRDERFEAWLKKWHFTADFLVSAALNTCTEIREGRHDGRWFYIEARYVPTVQIDLGVHEWQGDQQEAVTERLHRQVRQAVREAKKTLWNEYGYGTGPVKRQSTFQRDLRWLALVHVGGLSYAEVVRLDENEMDGIDEGIVRKAVKFTAEQCVGLDLREVSKGRPAAKEIRN